MKEEAVIKLHDSVLLDREGIRKRGKETKTTKNKEKLIIIIMIKMMMKEI